MSIVRTFTCSHSNKQPFALKFNYYYNHSKYFRSCLFILSVVYVILVRVFCVCLCVSFLQLRYGRHIEWIRQTLCRSFHSDTNATYISPKPWVIIVIVFSLFPPAHFFCAFIFQIHELVMFVRDLSLFCVTI